MKLPRTIKELKPNKLRKKRYSISFDIMDGYIIHPLYDVSNYQAKQIVVYII